MALLFTASGRAQLSRAVLLTALLPVGCAARTGTDSVETPASSQRSIPYQGAFGSSNPPPPPMPPMQKPLDAPTMEALDTWWERPSPKGPSPIPVQQPTGIRIEGNGPIIQALPGPPAFPDKIPKRLQVVYPGNVPFSNNVKQLTKGTFRAVAIDNTANDTKLSKDSMAAEITFTDVSGDSWRLEQVMLAPISPNPIMEPWYGGVAIGIRYHGDTGRGTPAEPLVQCELCSWGWADIYKNGTRVASGAPLHIMLTSDVRGDDFKYMCYDCTDKPIREVHVIVPPSAYLPSPGGFLHVMWENAQWTRGSPAEMSAHLSRLEEKVPTIELSAVPHLKWDQTEVRVRAGQKYRLIVHNNDPVSFHQFSLHSTPEGTGHHGHSADTRHDHGGAAGGTGPLWKPGEKPHKHAKENPPAPRHVFLPLPQGSTWATFVTFNKPGEYEFMCPVGNHYRRGMEGKFVVTDGSPAKGDQQR